MQTQYAVTFQSGDRYYAKGDNDFFVIEKIFNTKDFITARVKGIVKITQYIYTQTSPIVYENLWRIVR